ncbi:DNA polymerase I [bacterium]|nr:DNA polymerase I [bacterium]
MPDTLYAIDVFSLVFQVFHAIPPMTGANGQPTNAVFGFTRDLLNILKQKQPDFLVCALDSPGPGKREEAYSDYKANRDEMPDELRPQIPVIIEVIEAFGIPAIGLSGWEADDVLATLAHRAEEQSIAARIVTNDKDARQLISPLVRLYNVRKDVELDEAVLLDDWGIRPDQVVDFQALVGDKVDNVPGVPLVGPKKASALLNQFGTLEDVLAHADEAPGKKLAENLKMYAEQARISRFLVELKRDLDFDFDWDAARPGRFDIDRLTEIFRECGFRRFTDEIRQLASDGGEATPKTGLFEAGEPVVDVVADETQLEALLDRLSKASQVGVRIELCGLDPLTSEIAALTIAWDHRHSAFVPLNEDAGASALKPATVWSKLAATLAGSRVKFSGHDLKAVLVALRQAGVAIGEEATGVDSMVGSYLLAAGSRNYSLARLVEQYCDGTLAPLSALYEANSGELPKLTAEQLAHHSAEEACLTLSVVDQLHGELISQELAPLYDDLERPLISVLADLESTGIRVDRDELDRQNAEVSARLETLIAEIHAAAGEAFNIDSPKQLRTILFDKLELPVLKKTKTGPSTDQEVLEQLAAIHPLPESIIAHRHLVKLKGTYLDALPKLINPRTGRIHTSFSQVTAATGRLSSSNPNLQNIPIRTPEGERIRKAFVPGEPGWKLLCADYSQIELRMVAHFSGDESLRKAFADGVDVHRAVAAEVFGVEPEDVDSGQRRIAKAVNFGVIYGQSAFGLSQALGISREEAADFIDGYFARYHGVAAFLNETLETCLATGYAKTILGRRRAISGVRPASKRTGQLNMPERTAVNTVIQGSAADLIKQAMLKVHRRLHRETHPARMLLQIHDELVFETPDSEVASLTDLVRHEMEHAMLLDVPVTVDIATGENWHATRRPASRPQEAFAASEGQKGLQRQ